MRFGVGVRGVRGALDLVGGALAAAVVAVPPPAPPAAVAVTVPSMPAAKWPAMVQTTW